MLVLSRNRDESIMIGDKKSDIEAGRAAGVRLCILVGKDKDGIARDMEHVYSLFPVLRERSRQMAGSLSGGEQQMCAIARAMMSRPKILLLDEPSLGLAPILVKQIFQILQTLKDEGTTVFLVEQNARMALSMADRGYVLQTGNLVKEGPGRELLEDEEVRKAYLGK